VTLRRLTFLLAAAVLTACEQSTTPSLSTLVSDSTIAVDVANSAGDAIASALEAMAANEVALALPGASMSASPLGASLTSNSLSFNRTRTCFDVNGAVVAGCSPLSSVRKVVTFVTIDGNRSGSHTTEGGKTVTWSGAVHRVANDTVVRNYNGAVEVSRTHSDVTVGHDTSTFVAENVSRFLSEATRDSVKAVTWNLPRSQNPFPVSGSVVRVDTVHVEATRGSDSRSRTVVWTIRVDFPADSQGNVVLQVNDKTCNLNLVTHVVSSCQ
jgi:hypothetical protein